MFPHCRSSYHNIADYYAQHESFLCIPYNRRWKTPHIPNANKGVPERGYGDWKVYGEIKG